MRARERDEGRIIVMKIKGDHCKHALMELKIVINLNMDILLSTNTRIVQRDLDLIWVMFECSSSLTNSVRCRIAGITISFHHLLHSLLLLFIKPPYYSYYWLPVVFVYQAGKHQMKPNISLS